MCKWHDWQQPYQIMPHVIDQVISYNHGIGLQTTCMVGHVIMVGLFCFLQSFYLSDMRVFCKFKSHDIGELGFTMTGRRTLCREFMVLGKSSCSWWFIYMDFDIIRFISLRGFLSRVNWLAMFSFC